MYNEETNTTYKGIVIAIAIVVVGILLANAGDMFTIITSEGILY